MLDTARYHDNTRRTEPAGLIDLADRAPWRQLDEDAFAFRHRLAEHPLFTLERLADLSSQVLDRPDISRAFRGADLKLPRDELKRRMRDSILGVENNGLWLSLHYLDEVDPAYERLFDQLMADIEDLAEVPVRQRMRWGSMSVFMNAPGLQVPYHFDHETNFLMQIRGEKSVRLYPKGRGTLCEEEIEDFYRFNALAARYRDELAEAGTPYTLTPGVGVHHPPLAPHLIRNGSEVSVSLAIYYVMSDMEYRARVYQVNFCMRKMGLHPRPPGESPWVDAAKERLIRALSMSHPRTHDEMLYSGIQRLTAPARMARALGRRVRGALHHPASA
ncbi:MAG: cupin-like domain-containing protein [Rhodocyclaceae bacterium]|nr:cupin-like domain-containing protein [Pseudomonadota bacterium]MDQ7973192.1 cupin-like domain-containing protein [Rhodocyclaceae bacterium]MDQ8000306.1 cupin-like domain-containing protein [Pseudomonadota bacterium]